MGAARHPPALIIVLGVCFKRVKDTGTFLAAFMAKGKAVNGRARVSCHSPRASCVEIADPADRRLRDPLNDRAHDCAAIPRR